MLSSVSKLADKQFVVGFLLPSLLFAIATWLAFLPTCPSWFKSGCALMADIHNAFANLTLVAAAVWVLAILLLTANTPIYRLLEGYTYPFSRLNKLRERHVKRFIALSKEKQTLLDGGLKSKASIRLRELLTNYPTQETEILPTQFGNRIRAFETYARDVYGADSISVWLRLASVVPKEFQDCVGDARSQVDFFVNICILSLVFAAISGIDIAVSSYNTGPNIRLVSVLAYELILLALSILVAYCSYKSASARVVFWGDLVKSAFDCYLPKLASQLGYMLPPLESQRRLFWRRMSRLYTYRRTIPDGNYQFLGSSEQSFEPSVSAPAPRESGEVDDIEREDDASA